MKFAQIIEFRTDHIDTFNANLDAWMTRTAGRRIPHTAVLRRDRDGGNTYLFLVEFASYEAAMENSNRPETGEFAARMQALCDGPPIFHNLDVRYEAQID